MTTATRTRKPAAMPAESAAAEEPSAPRPGHYELVRIDQVVVDEGFNNRGELGDLVELTTSIKELGVLQPLLGYRDADSKVHVTAGHRRLAAAALAGVDLIPFVLRELDEAQRLEALLVENLHRLDLTPLEEAEGYQRLASEPHGLSQRQIAAKVGRSQPHVSKRLSLLKLPPRARGLVVDDILSMEGAVVLAGEQIEVIDRVVDLAIAEAKRGWRINVEREVQSAKRQLERDQKVAATREKLAAEKVSILKQEPGYGSRSTMRLGTGHGMLPMSVKDHAKEPCHAAFIREHDGEAIYFCTKPENHKKVEDKKVAAAIRSLESNRSYSAAGADKAKKKAAETRQRNKDLRAVAPARAEAIAGLLSGKPKKEQVLDFVLLQLLQRTIDETGGPARIAARMLGVPESREGRPTWSGYLNPGDTGFSDRLLKLAYAVSLGLGEEPIRMLPERGHFDSELVISCERLFEHLQAAGYRPEKVELDQLKKADRWSARNRIEGKVSKAPGAKPAEIAAEQEPGALPAPEASSAPAQPVQARKSKSRPAAGDGPAEALTSPAQLTPTEGALEEAPAIRAADGTVWKRGPFGYSAAGREEIYATLSALQAFEPEPLVAMELAEARS